MGVTARRTICLAMIVLLFPVINADSIVELGEMVNLEEFDMGLVGAVTDQQNEEVLAYGKNSKMIIMNLKNPRNNFDLKWNQSYNMSDADYHPGGKTALIVGEQGIVLRYSKTTGEAVRVGNYLQYANNKLESISWNGDGSWAYIGSEEGNIWRFRGGVDNTSQTYLISKRILSKITSIDCHNQVNLCVVTTLYDGIGIIDDTHRISWIGGTNYPWTDINCPKGNSCVAISTENNLGAIILDLNEPSNSSLEVTYLGEIEGKMRIVESQNWDSSLITLVPFSLIEYNSTTNQAFLWLEHFDVKEFSAALSDENIISTWGLNENSGWILTSQGTVIKYESIAINSNNELTVPVPVILIFIAITIGIFYNKIVRIRYKK